MNEHRINVGGVTFLVDVNKEEAVKNYLSHVSLGECVRLWNESASETGNNEIWDGVDEYCELYEPKADEVARMVFFGDIRNWGDYVTLNGYGNFESAYPQDLFGDSDFVAWLMENADCGFVVRAYNSYEGIADCADLEELAQELKGLELLPVPCVVEYECVGIEV